MFFKFLHKFAFEFLKTTMFIVLFLPGAGSKPNKITNIPILSFKNNEKIGHKVSKSLIML